MNNLNVIQKNNNDNNFIYELVFNAVTNISNSGKPNDIKLKIIRIIIKIIENIIKAETNNEDSSKFRKIKVTNPNISLIFDIKGMYEFIKSLGFNEKFFGEDLCLYLPSKKINILLFQQLISFIELLSLNFQEIDNKSNYYEINNNQQNNFINNNFNIKIHNHNNQNNINAQNNLNFVNNFNKIKGPSNEGEKILKATGQERFQRALKFTKNQNPNQINWNLKQNNNNNFQPNIHTFNDINQNQININNNINFPIQDNNKKCRDEIGKRCLQLTNNFRAKNNLPPLLWDDTIWRIAYTHSKNMGDRKVPFGHNGFNERISQFPFYFSIACENVFMCQGFRDYAVANGAVNGWINSPGHRKNLLSDTTHCEIATYITRSGAYYLTQMFVRK